MCVCVVVCVVVVVVVVVCVVAVVVAVVVVVVVVCCCCVLWYGRGINGARTSLKRMETFALSTAASKDERL